jgi:hypothetical protein
MDKKTYREVKTELNNFIDQISNKKDYDEFKDFSIEVLNYQTKLNEYNKIKLGLFRATFTNDRNRLNKAWKYYSKILDSVNHLSSVKTIDRLYQQNVSVLNK